MHNEIMNADLPDKKPWLIHDLVPPMMTIQLPLVINNPRLLNSIRGLALHLMQVQYCNIGYFFKSLHTKDIENLRQLVKRHEQEVNSDSNYSGNTTNLATQELILLCFLLGRAEGETETSPEFISKALPMLVTLIYVEEMVRKDGLKVNYRHYSLTDCTKPLVINKTILELQKMFKDRNEKE